MEYVGIDDVALALPALYLPIDQLAEARNIDADKLKYGLGLYEMAVCDVDEDVISLAAKAVIDLVKRNELKPYEVGRIYVGTESSVDGSKPIATYLLGLLVKYYESIQVDATPLRNCDALDMTFACVGAVDAMHNSLLWLQSQPKDTVAIVVATDDAKYELDSTGEYTQGAGATAILLKRNPRLLEINLKVGVATKDEHDFFKPIRKHVNPSEDQSEFADRIHMEYRETPIFDGPYSNKTYGSRINEAWDHFKEMNEDCPELEDFSKYIFHLPYAYHGRRIFSDLYFHDQSKRGLYDKYLADHNLSIPDESDEDYNLKYKAFLKAKTKTNTFVGIIKDKIEPSERLSSKIGNVYTASIFIALIGAMYYSEGDDLTGKDVLLIAYGSGSKSKVLHAQVKSGWKDVCSQWNIDDLLNERTKITFSQYMSLRCHKIDQPIGSCKPVKQVATGILDTNKYARYYQLKS